MTKQIYSAVILLFLNLQTLNVAAADGSMIATHLKFRFNQSENQKSLYQNLGLSESEELRAVEIARKTGVENTPVPTAVQEGAVLILKYKKGETHIDFSRVNESIVSVDQKIFRFKPDSTFTDFYNAFREKKSASRLWIESAYAENGTGDSFYQGLATWVGAISETFQNAYREGTSAELAKKIHDLLTPQKMIGNLVCHQGKLDSVRISKKDDSKTITIRSDFNNKNEIEKISVFSSGGMVDENCSFPFSEKKGKIDKDSRQWLKCGIFRKQVWGRIEDIYPIEDLVSCCQSKGCPQELQKLSKNHDNQKSSPSGIAQPAR